MVLRTVLVAALSLVIVTPTLRAAAAQCPRPRDTVGPNSVIDLNIVPADLLPRIAESRPPPSTSEIVRAQKLLFARLDPEVRDLALKSSVERYRGTWGPAAAYIGLSADQLEVYLAALAERDFQQEQLNATCVINLCTDPGRIYEQRKSDKELLGAEKYARFEMYQRALTERNFFKDLRWILPEADRPGDEASLRAAMAVAEEIERFKRESEAACADVWEYYVRHSELSLRLRSAAVWNGNSANFHSQHSYSAMRETMRMLDAAAPYLSANQLAAFKSVLDRELAAMQEWLRDGAIRDAARIEALADGKPDAEANRVGDRAMARDRLARLQYPERQAAEVAKLEASVREDLQWRASALGLSKREVNELSRELGRLQLQQKLAQLECEADSACDPRSLNKNAAHARMNELLGEKRAAFNRALDRALGRDPVDAVKLKPLRLRLPAGHPLSENAARKLAMAVAAERVRFDQQVRPDPGSSVDVTERIAWMKQRNARLHKVAARLLEREQLAVFDAMQEEDLNRYAR